MIRSVIITAAANRCRQFKRAVICHDQKIRGSFAAAIRTACMNRSLLCKEKVRTIQWKVSIHFVCTHLMVSPDSIFSAGIHQYARSNDIRFKKDGRVLNAPVHVRLCREVHYNIRRLFLKKPIYAFPVADIQLNKPKIRIIHNCFKGGKIPRIGQFVDTYDPVCRMFLQHVEYKVGTYKPGAAGYDYCHLYLSFKII